MAHLLSHGSFHSFPPYRPLPPVSFMHTHRTAATWLTRAKSLFQRKEKYRRWFGTGLGLRRQTWNKWLHAAKFVWGPLQEKAAAPRTYFSILNRGIQPSGRHATLCEENKTATANKLQLKNTLLWRNHLPTAPRMIRKGNDGKQSLKRSLCTYGAHIHSRKDWVYPPAQNYGPQVRATKPQVFCWNWQKKSKSGLGKLIMAAKLGIKFEIKFQKPCKNSKNGSDSGQKKMNGGKIGIKL